MINSFAFVLLFLLLIGLLEWYLRVKNGDKQYPMGSLMMNMSIGAMDQIGSLVYFSLLYFSLSYVYANFRIFEIPNSWYIWVLAYIAIDFLGYWYHRWSHRINILWAGHVTHHSSERFNFSNGFRTSPFQGINRIIFWASLPLIGFPPDVLVITLKFSGIYDFIVHTEYVPKLRVIEKIFITPSLHRVHHGKNDLYIDKNYGSTFSIWDRLFGTYQEETEKVVYGIKGSYLDNNPFWAIGHHYYYLWKTMKETPRWSDKLKFIFMPPEWRPTGVKEIETTHQNDKTPATNNLRYYAIFQISICTIGVIFLLAYRAFMPNWEFSLCAILCVINLSRSTMIFNDNISNRFEKQELIWLAFQAIVILTLMLTYSNFSLVYFVVSLLISLLLIGRINKVAYN